MDITSAHALAMEAQIVEALRTVFDPEIPVNIYELGLIYEIKVDSSNVVEITMTLTSPNCPAAGTLPGEVCEKAKGVPGVADAKVEVVFDPPWDPSRMSEAAKLELGLF
jgi:FeS assembly SUF system protein